MLLILALGCSVTIVFICFAVVIVAPCQYGDIVIITVVIAADI